MAERVIVPLMCHGDAAQNNVVLRQYDDKGMPAIVAVREKLLQAQG